LYLGTKTQITVFVPGTKTEIIIVTINAKVNPGDETFAAILQPAIK
jgi:hypothetical protein